MEIREYRPEDCAELTRLFYDTVHTVNRKDYTPAQLDAWADGTPDLDRWNRSLQEHFSLVALEGEKIIGFGDMDSTGYLDRREKDLGLLKEKLLAAQNRELSKAQQKYVANVAKLDAMSPLKVLSRGYAMAQKETGELIRSVKQTTAGESIVVSLADGKLNASILSIKEASHESENKDL